MTGAGTDERGTHVLVWAPGKQGKDVCLCVCRGWPSEFSVEIFDLPVYDGPVFFAQANGIWKMFAFEKNDLK